MSLHEEVELVPEEELFGLLERRRPDPKAFRAGIEARIAVRRAEAERAEKVERKGPAEPARTSVWRRAGALLPIEPFGALIGPGPGKALLGALALPALVLAAAFGGFVAGARSLQRSIAAALPVDPEARRRRRRQARQDRSLRFASFLVALVHNGMILAFLATWLVGGGFAVDVVLGTLVVSMAALVATVRGFARRGLLERHEVARLAVGILTSVFLGCFLWFHNLHLVHDVSSLGIGWPTSVVLLGIPACLAIAGQGRRVGVALGLGLAAVVALNALGVTRTSPGSLRAQLAGMDLNTAHLRGWRAAQALHDALAAVGAERPDREELLERIAAAARAPEDVHPMVWTAAWRMDLLGPAEWRALAADPRHSHQLDQLHRHAVLNPTPYYRYFVPLLLATREVSYDDREAIARGVFATWPEIGAHGALPQAVACLDMLDALERPDLVGALEGPARELVAAYWVSGDEAGLFDRAGGFTSNPEKFSTSFAQDTLAGVELMARFGVPERVDRWQLTSYLRHACWSLPLFLEPLPRLEAESRAALLLLRERIDLPPRTWLEAVLAERLFLGALLVVGLCLLAVRLAPPLPDPLQPPPGGAQP
ncbi:MAG: hypothetical protein AB1726_15825 [Planctomycetota bacterium]